MQFNQAPAPRESSLGDAYDPTANYSIDDLCIHDNVLCKCITPISGGEAWNSAHWIETNIGDEIKAVNSKITPESLTIINDSCYVHDVGNMCVLEIGGKITPISSGNQAVIATLPEGYRPVRATYGVIAVEGGTSNKYALISINASGDIRVYNYSGVTANYIYGNVAFVR